MPQQGRSVRWVDDEAGLLEPHRIFLRDKGFDVESATNADDAAELARRRPFDLILLDEQMPGTRGLDALKELRESSPNLQVVMVTKSEEDTTLNEALGKNIGGLPWTPVRPGQGYCMVGGLFRWRRLHPQAAARAFAQPLRAQPPRAPRVAHHTGRC